MSKKAMASPEDKAYEIMRELDVDYVLVIFGGMVGYSSDGNLLTYLKTKPIELLGTVERLKCKK